MTHVKPLIILFLTALITISCSSTETKPAGPEEYNMAINDAKISLDKAKKAHYEWRDSRKILKQAETAAEAGDYEKATKLAHKARRQGEMAVNQAKEQYNAGPR